jgi:hypothetical protein
MALATKPVFCGCRTVNHLRSFFAGVPIAFIFVQNADADPARGDHLSKPSRVIFGPALQRDKQNLALETNTPTQIPGVIAELDGVSDRARLEAQPSFRGRADDDRALAIDQKDGAVEQFLVTRQRNRKFFAPSCGRQVPAPRQIGDRNMDEINRTAMLEAMNFLRERGFQAAAQDMIDAQHCCQALSR